MANLGTAATGTSAISSSSSTTTSNTQTPTETDPLLPSSKKSPRKSKRWLGAAAPALLIPFVLSASLSRGFTIAPRVEVYTRLACNAVRPEHTAFDPPFPVYPNHTSPVILPPFDPQSNQSISSLTLAASSRPSSPGAPSKECLADPDVQAAAAELQTVMTIIAGALSALTSGYWGVYGDKHGRTTVMILVVLGFLSQDLVFILTSWFGSRLRSGQYILLLGPFLEGLLGSWAAFMAIQNAYISDCSESGSRANVFSRFAGLYFAGVAFGPGFGSFILQKFGLKTINLIYMAVVFNAFNLLYVIFLLPESLSEEARSGLKKVRDAKKKLRLAGSSTTATPIVTSPNSSGTLTPTPSELLNLPPGVIRSPDTLPDHSGHAAHASGAGKPTWWRERVRKTFKFLAPLVILLPKRNTLGGGRSNASKWDWDLPLIGVALFSNYLSNGSYSNKYLYAEHMFGWGATELGYYVTVVASARALWLLVILPYIIKMYKPKPPQLPSTASKSIFPPIPPTPAQRRAYLLPTIAFDLRVARLSLLVDTISFFLVGAFSTPMAFVLTTCLSSFGGGMAPATQSLALALVAHQSGPDVEDESHIGVGGMFGAISVLQAIGQNILGPLLFGGLYAGTVRFFPSMIFILGGLLLATALIALLFVAPHRKISPTLRRKTAEAIHAASLPVTSTETNPARKWTQRKRARGRSLTSKDLRRASDVGQRSVYSEAEASSSHSSLREAMKSVEGGGSSSAP